MTSSTRLSRLRALPALVAVAFLVVSTAPADAAGAKRDKKAPATLPGSQLARDAGLAGLLSGLLPGLLPPAPTADPPAPSVSQTVTASTVKVSGVACGVRVDGSGFSAAPDTVVTNAHVVAGVANPQVVCPDGRRLGA